MIFFLRPLHAPPRRRILELLQQRAMTAGQIADCFAISKPSISHHLDLLKQADLIVAEKSGQFIVYSLSTSVLDDCIAWLIKLKKKGRYEKNKSRMAAIADSGGFNFRPRSAFGLNGAPAAPSLV